MGMVARLEKFFVPVYISIYKQAFQPEDLASLLFKSHNNRPLPRGLPDHGLGRMAKLSLEVLRTNSLVHLVFYINLRKMALRNSKKDTVPIHHAMNANIHKNFFVY